MAAAAGGAWAAPEADEVKHLPLFGAPPAAQYSGFLNASAAEQGTMLHYWFAHTNMVTVTEDTPVVLWLNGGPGSSSILGMLQELGPVLINQTGGLFKNPWSWADHAHVVVLESPAGVGYSYCAAMTSGKGGCQNTDKSTAAAARAALQHFFTAKFPELAKNPFFITGESYAGVYVPTLTQEILDNAPEINIKGIAVGDPCTDNKAQADTMDAVWYGHKYGFLQDDEYDFLRNNCSARAAHPLARGKWGSADPAAAASSSSSSSSLPVAVTYDTTSEACTLAVRHFMGSSSRGFSQQWPLAWINDLTLYGPAAVVGSGQKQSLNYMTAQYMMRKDVQEALHVDTAPAKLWPGPQPGWGYTKDYNACNSAAPKDADSMIDFYRRISPRLAHGATVYNGDTDPCVSYEGTRNAIELVGFAEREGGHMRPWFFNAAATTTKILAEKPVLFGPDLALHSIGPQFGGHSTNYEKGLSFVTVHGSGHMVPQFRPQAALWMLTAVLHNTLLTPLYQSDKNVSAMTDDGFSRYLDAWTTKAKAEAMPASD